MPIRFRCRYCNQLIGIARRKAGTDVSCPTCHGRLIVPADDAGATDGGADASPQPLFERSDFEDYLRSPFSEEAARHSAAARARGGRPFPVVPQVIDVDRLPDGDGAIHAAAPPVGLLLTPARLTVVVVAVILMLAAAFAGGIAVDRLFLIRPVP